MRKLKLILGLMVVFMMFGALSVSAIDVIPSKSVMVNAQEKYIRTAYINGEEYVMLRDIAEALNGTPRQFNVTYYDLGSINIAENEAYASQYIEPINDATIHPGNLVIYKDWNLISMEHYLIDGRVFVKLNDLASILSLIIDYDSSSKMQHIVSSKSINYCGRDLVTAYYVPDGRSDYNWALEGGAYDYKGNLLEPGISAAGDKRNFKYGDYIYVEGFGVRKVTDCGGAIKGWRIDLCLTGDQYRNNWEDNKRCNIYKLSDLNN